MVGLVFFFFIPAVIAYAIISAIQETRKRDY